MNDYHLSFHIAKRKCGKRYTQEQIPCHNIPPSLGSSHTWYSILTPINGGMTIPNMDTGLDT